MGITVEFVDGPLPAAAPIRPRNAGAVIAFEGVVRGEENGRAIAALDYTAYQPMAQNMLRQIAEQLFAELGLIAIHIQHSRGRIPAGSVSFRLVIAATHRKEALAAMDRFIDQMKQDVPIWKSPVP